MKKPATLALGILIGVGAAALVGAVQTNAAGELPEGELKRGLLLAPVKLKMRGRNRTLVAEGSYIVNAQGGCNDCHTNPSFQEDGNPYEGEPTKINKVNYLAGGAQFGPFISRNITPDATGKPAGMTFREFERAFRHGRDVNDQLLQVMPWPVYGKMKTHDLRAIYEYLSAIPHAEPGTNPQ